MYYEHCWLYGSRTVRRPSRRRQFVGAAADFFDRRAAANADNLSESERRRCHCCCVLILLQFSMTKKHGRREPRRAPDQTFVSEKFLTFRGKFSQFYLFPKQFFDFHPPLF